MPRSKLIVPERTSIDYRAEPTASLFHSCDDVVRGIMGPIGSGKSVACVMEIFLRCQQQRAFNGRRRSRWAIIRNTYPELISTSMNTWKDWVPESYCHISMSSPIIGYLNFGLADGTRVDAEIYFLALDTDTDVKKLKSLELTGAWINEASEIPKAVLDMAVGRIDRFPSKSQGGVSWTGVIMDTNPPDDDSWWYQLAEVECPVGYSFFQQPPAVIKKPRKSDKDPIEYMPNVGQGAAPHAENIDNHNSGFEYYMRQIPGKNPEWIKVFLMGQYGTLMTGKPVYPEYVDSVHCASEPLKTYRGIPIILGWDFGLTPAVVICQLSPRGQFRIINELVAEDMGIRTFARDVVKPTLLNDYAGIPIISRGDPAGNQRSQTSEVTCIQELHEAGIPTHMAQTNEFIARREAVAGFLTRMIDGEPGFLISPTCRVTRKGFMSGYHYAQLRISGDTRFKTAPEKNKFSHPHDALQYAAMEAQVGSFSHGGPGYGASRGVAAGARSIHSGQRRNVTIRNPAGWT